MHILPKRNISALPSAYPKHRNWRVSPFSCCSWITAQQHTLGPAQNNAHAATICSHTAKCWGEVM